MAVPAISDHEQNILNHVRGAGDLRVWSVVVTIMGDMARGQGETVSGATLGLLLGALGIRPEATRVALHRLRKDGWISSQRAGRGSLYSLTDHGRAQTVTVTDRIYGPGLSAPENWHLVVTLLAADRPGYEAKLTSQGFTEVTPGVFLGTKEPRPNSGLLHFSDSTPDLPNDLLRQLVPDTLQDEVARLSALMGYVQRIDLEDMAALPRAALRVLVLHSWRRIALRLPALPLQSLWPEATLRADVHQLLNQLGRINANALPV